MNGILLSALLLLLGIPLAGAANFASEVMDATFKFNGGGTCWLVRRPAPDAASYLVTVAHAFNEDESAVVLLRKAEPDGSYSRHDFTLRILPDDTQSAL